MDKIIADQTIQVNEEGFLTDFTQWSKEIANELATEQEIEMTNKHWEVIEYIHTKFNNEEAISIRGIKKSGVINIKEFYQLFPGGPLKKATLIAGIPKPKSCI